MGISISIENLGKFNFLLTHSLRLSRSTTSWRCPAEKLYLHFIFY